MRGASQEQTTSVNREPTSETTRPFREKSFICQNGPWCLRMIRRLRELGSARFRGIMSVARRWERQMMDEPDLVTLFYRADWTRISLSAEVHGLSDWALRSKMLQPAQPGLSWVRADVPPGGAGSPCWYAGDGQALRYEFRDLAPLSADGGEFAFRVPPGLRVQHTDGWLLDEMDIPEGMRSAIRSAGSAAKAAHGFLSSLRGR